MDLTIKIKMPEKTRAEYKKPDLIEKCLDFMQICESDGDSAYHFNYLKSVYQKLSDLPKIPQQFVELYEKLEDFLTKYDVDQSSFDASTMRKHLKD